MKYGINIDRCWAKPGPDDAATFAAMKRYGLTVARLSVPIADDGIIERFRGLLDLAKSYGVTLMPVLLPPFEWGDRNDGKLYRFGNNDALWKQGYNRTFAFVSAFRDDVQDWSMGNEVNLKRLDANGSPLFGKGWTAAEFDTPVMRDWGWVLRGMCDAIYTVYNATGKPYRRVLGTTSTMFGFLEFMRSFGVIHDAIDYHYYEHLGTEPSKFWGGDKPTFNLFEKLGSYGLPVVIGEFNAGEVYDPDYANRDGDPKTEAGYRSFNAILHQVKTQTWANVEAMLAYTLLDEPAKAAPENRFGLMRDYSMPKVSMLLLAEANDPLTATEANALISRGLD